MAQHYSNPRRSSDPTALPDIETWQHGPCSDPIEAVACIATMDSNGVCAGPGWYYWFCLPGCLPDGEPIGPFGTEAEALEDARDGLYDDDGEEE